MAQRTNFRTSRCYYSAQKYFARSTTYGDIISCVCRTKDRRLRLLSHHGVYLFLACPFGISTAPGEYQARKAHEVLQDYYLNGALIYIDDTIIYGNEETFLVLTDQILSKLVEFDVRLKPSKCCFGMDHIGFLGHVFSESSMELSDKKVQGIRQIPEPTSFNAVRSFVRVVNYF